MDPSLAEWLKEYDRLNAELRPFYDRVGAKQDGRGHWQSPPTEPEEVLDSLWYFYSAALVNNGDVFGYLLYMIEHWKALEAIGARGCLEALEKLLPFYEEQQKLATEDEKKEYWHRTRSARAGAESLAEDPNDFARLLLAYAQKNAHRIGTDQEK